MGTEPDPVTDGDPCTSEAGVPEPGAGVPDPGAGVPEPGAGVPEAGVPEPGVPEPGAGVPAEEEYPEGDPDALTTRAASALRRGAIGAVFSGFAMGLREVFEVERQEPAIMIETSGEPPRDLPVEADLEVGPPRGSVVKVRPWLLDEASPGDDRDGAGTAVAPPESADIPPGADPLPGQSGGPSSGNRTATPARPARPARRPGRRR